MKTLKLRVWSVGLVVSTLLFCSGCQEQRAKADVPVLPAPVVGEADKAPETPTLGDVTDATLLAGAEGPQTNAPAKPPRTVQEATMPANLKPSPALAEIIKLVQAGVSEQVILSYVTNSTEVFRADSDSIVYLNDLGVTTPVITAIIQHDASPDSRARVASANAIKPLPPGVSLTTPATGVYPPASANIGPWPGGNVGAVPATNEQASAALPPAVETAPPATDSVSADYFYDNLAPYGSWVDVDGYGLCWRPTVAVVDSSWRPYCQGGRWLWSDSGWYWYSDYSWGWAPFHYGRWCSYPRLGWLWVPDTCWGPSWVTWRSSPSYCGWAPLPPGCTYSSFGLSWYSRGVGVSFDFGLAPSCWSFVPVSRFCDWHVSRHALPIHETRNIINKTTIINNIRGNNNTIVNSGIDVNQVARATRTKIPRATVREQPLSVANRSRPERVETSGSTIAVVRPQLPRNPPAVAATGRGPGVKTHGTGANVTPTSAAVTRFSPLGDTVRHQGRSETVADAAPKKSVPVFRSEPVRVSPPVVTGNNQAPSFTPKPDTSVASNKRITILPAEATVSHNSGTSASETRPAAPQTSAHRNSGEHRDNGINRASRPPEPIRSAPNNAFARGNSDPGIRSFANPGNAAPRAERSIPQSAPLVPSARMTPPAASAPITRGPAIVPGSPAARMPSAGGGPAISPHGGGGNISAPSAAPRASSAPSVSAPSRSSSSGGGGNSSGGGGRGGRGRE